MQEELVSALAEVSRLTADLASHQQSQVGKPSFSSSEEERSQVMKFLFNLQRSGITNMMAADEFVKKRFGFSTAKSQDFLFDYIDNYNELEAKYGMPAIQVEAVQQVAAVKKRKGPKPYSEMTPEELAEVKAKKSQAKSVTVSSSELIETPAEPVVAQPVAQPVAQLVAEPLAQPLIKSEPTKKKIIVKLAKKQDGEVKPKGVLIWNAFMQTVKAEMSVSLGGAEPSYNDVVKKSQELKEAEPEAYKLFSDNWSA